jgi:hypothetical protein
MAEWLKAPAWKACILSQVSRVQIPFSPPKIRNKILELKIFESVAYFKKYPELEPRFNFLNRCLENYYFRGTIRSL